MSILQDGYTVELDTANKVVKVLNRELEQVGVNGNLISSSIPPKIRQEVTKALSQISSLFNAPMDVEWGYGSDGLKIFQARPIIFKNALNIHNGKKNMILIAGGQGSRMQEMFVDGSAPFTKHFLPIPEKGGTLIGAVIEKSRDYFDTIEISSSHNTIDFMGPVFDNDPKITISMDTQLIGPLYRPFEEAIKTKKRVYACCGDVYSNFNWDQMEKFHNSHNKPVTILVSRSFPADKAACFNINEDGTIESWVRKDRSTAEDYINIGGYILDPNPKLEEIMKNMVTTGKCKEDLFFKECIKEGIIAGYREKSFSCNLNSPEVYQALVRKMINERSRQGHALSRISEHYRGT